MTSNTAKIAREPRRNLDPKPIQKPERVRLKFLSVGSFVAATTSSEEPSDNDQDEDEIFVHIVWN